MQRRGFLKLSAVGAASAVLPAWGCGGGDGLAEPRVESAADGFTSYDALGHRFDIDSAANLVRWTAPNEAPLALNAGFNFPVAAVSDASGRAYVLDRGNARVLVFGTRGELLLEFGGFGEADHADAMMYPADLVFGQDGTLYVADSLNQRVQAFSPNASGLVDGDRVRVLGEGTFELPRSLAIAPDGSLHVLDLGHREVLVFDASDFLVTRYAAIDAAGQRLTLPRHLAIDGQGFAYISDISRSTIEAIDTQGGAHLDSLALRSGGVTMMSPQQLSIAPDATLRVAATAVEYV